MKTKLTFPEKTFIFLACMMFPLFSYGQVNVSLTVPDSLKGCVTNVYRANLTLVGSGPVTISIHDSINLACGTGNSCNTSRTTFFEVDTVGSGIGQFAYNYSTLSWELVLNAPGVYSIPYSVVIDCSIIPSCFDSVLTSLELLQIWSSPGITFSINSGDSTHNDQIFYPKFAEFSSGNYSGNYLDTISIIHQYKNTGNAEGVIQFAFSYDTLLNCSGITVDSVLYAVGTNSLAATYILLGAGMTTETIPEGEFLFLKKKVIVIDCLDISCSGERDTLIWKCAFMDTAFCDSCQHLLNNVYSIQNSALGQLSIIRSYPDSAGPILDYTCMNQKLPWHYKIVNTGTVNIPQAKISFSNASNQIRYLGLIDVNDININPYLAANSTFDTTLIVRSQHLCSAAIDSALQQLTITIHDFMIGDSIVLEFETYRCCEEDTSLYNQVLNFGSGRFDVETRDSCNNVNSYIVFVPNIPEWDMGVEFYPPVSSLVVPKGATIGPSTPPLFVDYISNSSYNNSSYSLFGCPDSNCVMNGLLRVNIHCLPGLFVDTAQVLFVNYPTGPLKFWQPVFSYSNYVGSCDTLDYYYYFDLSDTNARALIHEGRFKFQLKSCCVGLPTTPYSINFDILFNPNSCYSINLSDTTHQIPPVCTSCCFLPLASTGDRITVNCPGCTNPGPEILSYSMKRINYGLQDANDNKKADYPYAAIDSTYLATYEPFMKTQFANHGDYVQDLMMSHFPDGAADSTGYTYSEMVADSGILNFMHINRNFIADDPYSIGITPYFIELYIDVPDTVSGNCMDCIEYSADTNFRTIHVLEINSAQISSYVTYNPLNNVFFTFSALDSVANIFQNVFYHDTTSMYEFTGYFTNQRYRMKTKYELCGLFQPIDLTVYQPVNEQIQQLNILNEQYMSGQQLDAATYLSVPNAPGNVADTTVLDQDFADSYKFWCTFLDGRFWLYSDQTSNFSQYQTSDTNVCQKYITINAFSLTGGNQYKKLYPFEFRNPAFSLNNLSAFVPPGYSADTIATIQTSYTILGLNNNAPLFSLPQTFAITQSGDSVNINVDSLLIVHGLYCLNDSAAFQSDSLLIGDNQLNFKIRIKLNSQDCTPGAFYDPALNDLTTTFDDFHFGCIDSLISSCNAIVLSPSRQTESDTLRTPNPNLSIYAAPNSISAGTNQICWNLVIENDNDIASNVFIAPAQVNYLSNWTIQSNGTVLFPDSAGIFHYASSVGIITLPLNDTLCAVYNSCVISDTLPILFGWGCFGYPLSLNDSSYCFIDTAYIGFTDALIDPTPGENHPDTFDLCEPFWITGSLSEPTGGTLYPFGVYLTEINPELNILSVGLTNCGNSDTLFLGGSGPNWNITDSMLTVLDLDTFSLGACLKLVMQIEPTCGTAYTIGDPLKIPNIFFQYYTFCEDTLEIQAKYSALLPPGGTSYFSGVSHCSNCFTIDKSVLQNPAIAGDTVDFQIIICGYNAMIDTVSFMDNLPANFTPITTIPDSIIIPSTGCNTLIVSGIYSQGGNCNDLAMQNTATIFFGSDSLSDEACTHVYAACANGTDVIIVPDSSFGSTYGTGFYSTNVYIDGRFYIDSLFYLQAAYVLMNAGAQIIVLPNAQLLSDSSLIEGCDFMWRGIYVEETGAVTLREYTTVRDADIAVYANNKSRIIFDHSSFENNMRGLYVPPRAGGNLITHQFYGNRFGTLNPGFKNTYPGQAPVGKIPFSGMEVNDMITFNVGDAVSDSNYFYDMNLGIIGWRSVMKVTNNKFEHIQRDTSNSNHVWYGAAITCIDTTTFPGKITIEPIASNSWTIDSCRIGVYTNHSTLSINQVKMTQMLSGIVSRRTFLTTYVSDCLIEARRFGIDWRFNAGATDMSASHNVIKMSGSVNGIGINMEELSTAGVPNYRIEENSNIDITSAFAGIRARNVYNPQIIKNTIFQKTNGITSPNTIGILLENDSTGVVKCNTVISPDITYTATYGMRVSLTSGTTISCNEVDSNQIGFHFMNFSPLNLRANIMKNNFWGLEIDTLSAIGIQKNKGNFWINYRDTVGAVHWDTNLTVIQNSEFKTSGALLSSYWPAIPGWDNGWFTVQAGSEEICGLTCDVHELTDTTRDESLEKSIAEGTFETSEENDVVAKQYLFDLLSADSLMLNSDPAYANFYNAHATGEVGKINEVTSLIKNILQPGHSYLDSLAAMNSVWNVYVQNLHELDSLAFANPQINYSSQQESIAVQIISIMNDINVLIIAQRQYAIGQSSSATILNNGIVPDQVPQVNEKFINQMSLQLVDFGTESLNNNINQILLVAQQCPLYGGPAVYRARTLVGLFNDSLNFDDACSQNLFSRTQQPGQNSVTKPKIKIIPNPATDKITIILNEKFNGMCQIELTNSMGEIVLKENKNCKEKSVNINISGLSQGVYTVKVLIGESSFGINKLIIAR